LDVGKCQWAQLTKPQAEKQIAWLLDDQTLIWQARRISDDLETLETCTFTTLRDAAYWLLLKNDAMYNAAAIPNVILGSPSGVVESGGTLR
jgi:hypothetical protein